MKTPTLKHYISELWLDIENTYGEQPRRLRHIVEKTAKDQRHLDLIDAQLEGANFTELTKGSTGQQKTEINPLLAMRDKVSRTVTDDLEALQLTARASYKKQEGKVETTNDPLQDFISNIQNIINQNKEQ